MATYLQNVSTAKYGPFQSPERDEVLWNLNRCMADMGDIVSFQSLMRDAGLWNWRADWPVGEYSDAFNRWCATGGSGTRCICPTQSASQNPFQSLERDEGLWN